ncbi:hypothetical protein D3C75_1283060 [compost metagenome]
MHHLTVNDNLTDTIAIHDATTDVSQLQLSDPLAVLTAFHHTRKTSQWATEGEVG